MSLLLERGSSSRSTRRKRRRVRRGALGAGALAVLFAVAALAAAVLAGRGPPPPPLAAGPADGEQLTTLVALTLSDDLSGQADSLTLFSIDRSGRSPSVMFLPVGTLGLIPGQGFDAIGKALTFGQVGLQLVTVENLLGIDVDRGIVVEDASLGAVIDALGGIEVDVAERLLEADGQGRRRPAFAPGPQRMSGAAAVTYLTYRGEGETELDRFVRAQKVWEAIFAAGRDARRFGNAVSNAGIQESQHLGAMLAAFAIRPAAERAYEVLPTEPVGGGPEEIYRVGEEGVRLLVQRAFRDSLPREGPWVDARVEVLNGNGTPEVGERVAQRLVPAGLRIVVSGNASSFTFERTRVVVYGDDEESLVLGRKVRDLLGVGEVEVGRRGQTVVDVTVVVGRDFREG